MIVVLTAGCAMPPPDPVTVAEDARSEAGVWTTIAEGSVHYSWMARATTAGIRDREGDALPRFALDSWSDLRVEVTWRSALSSDVRVQVGTTDGDPVGAEGGSPVRVLAEGAEPGEYVIEIVPVDDPGAIVDTTFTWRASAKPRPDLEAAATTERILGRFDGLVVVPFTPTGPDHVVWCEVGSSEMAVMLYPSGTFVLHGTREGSVVVHGPTAGPVRVGPLPGSGGGGGFSIKVDEEGWNVPMWVAFGAGDRSGPSTITVGFSGSDIALPHPTRQGPIRVFTEDDWAGVLDARAGDHLRGASAVVERSLPFETSNGTVMVALLGSGTARVDDVTLSNDHGTRSWSGTGLLGGATTLSGDDELAPPIIRVIDAADAWTLSIRQSARVGAAGDLVLVADMELPEAVEP